METAIVIPGFKETFHTSHPAWFKQIEEEANRRIIESQFAETCRKGQKEAMKRLMVNLWPFVEIFPRLVGRGYMSLLSPTLYMQYGVLHMLSLSYHSMMFLGGIERDEKSHRALWLGSGSGLGLKYPEDYEHPIMQETQTWIDSVALQAEPADRFLAFIAIEFIAESVSKNFLLSEQFKNAMGNSHTGLGWFTVHTIDHGEKSHANLELHLSLAFRSESDESNEQRAKQVILGVVDKFLGAANACI